MTNGSQELRFCDRVISWLKLNATKKMNLLMCQLGPLGFGALVGVLRLDLTTRLPNDSNPQVLITQPNDGCPSSCRFGWPPASWHTTWLCNMEYMGCLMLNLRLFSATDPEGWVAGTILTDGGATLDPWPLEEFLSLNRCPRTLDT